VRPPVHVYEQPQQQQAPQQHRPSYQPRIDKQEPPVEQQQKLNLENPQLNHKKKQHHHHEQSKEFRHQNQPQKQQQQHSQQQRRRTQEKKESNGFFGLQNLFVQDNTNEYQQKRNEVDPGQARQDATKSPATGEIYAFSFFWFELHNKFKRIKFVHLIHSKRVALMS